MEVEKKEGKYTSVVIDTLNALQNKEYVDHMLKKGSPNFDDWRDFGAEVLQLYNFLKVRGTIVQILGSEGTGKTVGGMFLNPDETVWMNCDNKPLSFTGANKLYPPDNSRKNYSIASTFKDVMEQCSAIYKVRKQDPLVFFILAHVDVYKLNNAERLRLRVLGKMATKLNIEGSTTHTYYTVVNPTEKDPLKKYQLSTQNSGFDTARSPMGMWSESTIPNNLKLILDKIIEDSKI